MQKEIFMLRKTAVRVLALVALAGAFASLPLLAQDSQDSQSVADAARRARQQKQAAAAKPANVITNESLPPAPAGEAPAAAPTAPANPADAAAPAAANGEKSAASTEAEQKKNEEIEGLKKQIKEKEESVNLAQRELALEQDTYYGKVDFQHDLAGKQKLDDMRSDLATKQRELGELKTKLADLGATETPKEPQAPATPPGPPGAITLPQ
jgi:hypothetical protein